MKHTWVPTALWPVHTQREVGVGQLAAQTVDTQVQKPHNRLQHWREEGTGQPIQLAPGGGSL